VNHSEIVSFLWGVADLIRDTFKRGKYQDVILPLTGSIAILVEQGYHPSCS
jgi:type I restriction-modification system DNA methylase subunit